MCNCHSILECCVRFSGVKLSIRSFNLFGGNYLNMAALNAKILNKVKYSITRPNKQMDTKKLSGKLFRCL